MESIRFLKFSQLLDATNKRIKSLKTELAPQYGVKGVHAFWLCELYRHPEGLTASNLATETGIDRSMISREIAQLTRKGMVTVEGQGARHYNARIHLTDKGREVAEQVSALALAVQAQADEGITEEELLGFYRTFEKLQRNLDKISIGPDSHTPA